ncbi:hypothetical protein TNCV_3769341 [Trichonephila clavipes]|nr:hypothetical protein TNCV_3769341 [Trichonephila clavipes]
MNRFYLNVIQRPDGHSWSASKAVLSLKKRKEVLELGLKHVPGSMPAEKCVEVLKSKLAKHGLFRKEDIVSITTDGATVKKKVGKLIGANQQLGYAHGIQLGVIDVLY